jgi:hypothetical protein
MLEVVYFLFIASCQGSVVLAAEVVNDQGLTVQAEP